MFAVLDVLFGWMPPICATLAFSSVVIFVAMFIYAIGKVKNRAEYEHPKSAAYAARPLAA